MADFFPISGDCYKFKLALPSVFATLSVHVSELVPFSYLGATEAPHLTDTDMREGKICLTKMMKEFGHGASFYGSKPSKTTPLHGSELLL